MRHYIRPILCAIALAMLGVAALRQRAPSPVARCAEAAMAKHADTAALCFYAFATTRDPSSGARTARALQARPSARAMVEYLASTVGDSPAGADAWLAAGVARRRAKAYAAAIVALERATDHRSPDDDLGRLRDAVGALLAYRVSGDYGLAAQKAALTYELVQHVRSPEDQAVALLNISALLLEWGNISISSGLIAGAKRLIGLPSKNYAAVLQMEGIIEQVRGRPRIAREVLLAARALAIRDHDDALVDELQYNLVATARAVGDFDQAARELSQVTQTDLTANSRAVYAYNQALNQIGRSKDDEAVVTISQVLSGSTADWVGRLIAIRGRALLGLRRFDQAEQDLRTAVTMIEAKRKALESDTFKSWLLADLRAPFEDLFLVYVKQQRYAEALAVIQRATARSIVDGLVRAAQTSQQTGRGIVATAARIAALRNIAGSIRASVVTDLPSLQTLVSRLRGAHVFTFFQAQTQLWLLALDGGGTIRAREIGSVTALREKLATFVAHADDAELAATLGAWLLPDDLMPAPGLPLFIFADDLLAGLSFEALRTHGSYLVERNPISYIPSATTLALASEVRPLAPVVVIGDPGGNLRFARAEALQVAATLHTAPHLGGGATRAVVRAARSAHLLHVAAHTDASDGPALLLSDGMLTASSIVDEGIAPEIVVMMACSSAGSTSRDELASLAYAFIAAGTRAVVASRWAVDDSLARRFSLAFYRAGGASDPVSATAEAQRELIQEQVRPSQWSTFVSFGGFYAKDPT